MQVLEKEYPWLRNLASDFRGWFSSSDQDRSGTCLSML